MNLAAYMEKLKEQLPEFRLNFQNNPTPENRIRLAMCLADAATHLREEFFDDLKIIVSDDVPETKAILTAAWANKIFRTDNLQEMLERLNVLRTYWKGCPVKRGQHFAFATMAFARVLAEVGLYHAKAAGLPAAFEYLHELRVLVALFPGEPEIRRPFARLLFSLATGLEALNADSLSDLPALSAELAEIAQQPCAMTAEITISVIEFLNSVQQRLRPSFPEF